MSSIDKRIVEMKFDNKQFEKGVSQTVNSLNGLKKGLALKGGTAGLESVNKAGRKVDLSPIAKGVETISNRFTTLGIVGKTVIENLTNSVISFAKRTVNPLKAVGAGFEEYEIKMNAIKTILANTKADGTNLEDVNVKLKELNEYSDNTVYNFAQMTDMVGKFAATSGELDSSVNIVKGMSNLAAEAGVENAKLQSSLYQVSQAMSGAYFQKMDWNSLENAGIATKAFKTDLIAMGKEMGAFNEMPGLLQQLEDGTMGLGMSLEKKWLTGDIFQAVTEMYAMDEAMTAAAGEVTTFTKLGVVMAETLQSGWTESWEAIIGDKVQSAKVLTSIADAFKAMKKPAMDARNATLQFWNQNGGREDIIMALVNSFAFLLDIFEPIKEAFKEIFPPATGQQLVDLSAKIRAFTERFKVTDEAAKQIKTTFKGLFSIVNIVKNVIGGLVGVVLGLGSGMSGASDGILIVTESIGRFLSGLDKAIQNTKVFDEVLGFLLPIAEAIHSKFKAITGAMYDFTASLRLNGGLKGLGARLLDFGEHIKATTSVIGGSSSGLSPALKGIGDTLTTFKNKVADFMSTISYAKISQVLKDGILGGGFILIVKRFSDMMKSGTDFMTGITGILDGVRKSLEAYQMNLKADALLKIASALLILSGALVIMSAIPREQLETAILSMTILFANLMGSMKALSMVVNAKSTAQLTLLSVALIALSVSILILAGAMKALSKLDIEEIAHGLLALGGISAILVATSKALSSSTSGMLMGALGLAAFAVALRLVIPMLSEVAQINPTELLMFAGAIVALGLAMKTMTGSISGAAALMIVSVALKSLGKRIQEFGSMDIETLKQGLLVLAAVFGILALAGLALGPMTPILFAISAALLSFGAAAALAGVGISLLAVGLTTLAGGITVLSLSIVPLVKAIVDGFVYAIQKLAEQVGPISDSIYRIVEGILKSLSRLIPMGIDIIMEFITAALFILGDRLPAFIKAGVEVIVAILTGIKDNIQRMTAIGIDIILGFIVGLLSQMPNIVDAAFKLIIAFIDGLTSAIENNTETLAQSLMNLFVVVLKAAANILIVAVKGFWGLGADIIGAVRDGIDAGIQWVVDKVIELKDKAVEEAKEIITEFLAIGGDIVQGLIDGIKGKFKDAKEAIEGLGSGLIEAINEKIGRASPAKEFIYIGQDMDNGVAVGIDKNAYKVTKSADAMLDKATASAKSAGERFKEHFTGLFQDTEISEIEAEKAGGRVTDSVATGIEQATPAVASAAASAGAVAGKSFLEKTKEQMDERKFYNQVSLTEELATWQKIQDHYAEGTEERKRADREVFTLQKELAGKMETIEKEHEETLSGIRDKLKADIRSLNEEYKNAFEERSKAIYASYGLFEEIAAKEDPLNPQKLMDNLATQVQVLSTWREDVASLTEKGVSEDLMDELREMGPKSAEQIHALNAMSDPALNKYVELWRSKHELSRRQATQEMQYMKEDIGTKTSELIAQASKQYGELKTVTAQKMGELRGASTKEVEEMQQEWTAEINTLRTNSTSGFEGLKTDIEGMGWQGVGKNIVGGMAEGVRDHTNELLIEVRAAARAALRAAERTLGVESPSKEFARIGKFSMEGLANGISQYTKLAINASKETGVNTLSAMKNAMAGVTNITDDIDTMPVIKPVMDLSDIQAGVSKMKGLLGTTSSTTARNASQIATKMNTSNESPIKAQTVKKEVIFNQNNYSPKALSRVEIYRQTNNQLKAVSI